MSTFGLDLAFWHGNSDKPHFCHDCVHSRLKLYVCRNLSGRKRTVVSGIWEDNPHAQWRTSSNHRRDQDTGAWFRLPSGCFRIYVIAIVYPDWIERGSCLAISILGFCIGYARRLCVLWLISHSYSVKLTRPLRYLISSAMNYHVDKLRYIFSCLNFNRVVHICYIQRTSRINFWNSTKKVTNLFLNVSSSQFRIPR